MAELDDLQKNEELVQLGADLSGGTLILLSAGDVEVATLTLSALASNALNTPAAGSATFKDMTDEGDAPGGIATKCELRDSGNVLRMTGTVTATGGGGDLTLASTTIAPGGTVSDNTITVTK